MKTTHPLFVAALLVFGPMFAPLMLPGSLAADEAAAVSPRDAEVKAPVVPEEEPAPDDAAPAEAAPADSTASLDLESTVRVIYSKDRPA
jgi:hypothetical protein